MGAFVVFHGFCTRNLLILSAADRLTMSVTSSMFGCPAFGGSDLACMQTGRQFYNPTFF